MADVAVSVLHVCIRFSSCFSPFCSLLPCSSSNKNMSFSIGGVPASAVYSAAVFSSHMTAVFAQTLRLPISSLMKSKLVCILWGLCSILVHNVGSAYPPSLLPHCIALPPQACCLYLKHSVHWQFVLAVFLFSPWLFLCIISTLPPSPSVNQTAAYLLSLTIMLSLTTHHTLFFFRLGFLLFFFFGGGGHLACSSKHWRGLRYSWASS